MTQSDDLAKAREGDKQAFARLIEPRERILYGLAMAICGSPHDAADALQEAVLRAYLRVGTLRNPDKFDSWIRRILVNCAREQWRRRREAPTEHLAVADDGQGQVPLPETVAHHLDIQRAMATLAPEVRTVVALRFMEDLSLPAIAQVVHRPVGTVKSRLHYGLKKLGAILSPDGPAGSAQTTEDGGGGFDQG